LLDLIALELRDALARPFVSARAETDVRIHHFLYTASHVNAALFA
jgi:hypothetical protein